MITALFVFLYLINAFLVNRWLFFLLVYIDKKNMFYDSKDPTADQTWWMWICCLSVIGTGIIVVMIFLELISRLFKLKIWSGLTKYFIPPQYRK